ncbi:DMT family transporter [Rhodobacteraceae bacterium ASV31]|nr:DMT family transporter [Anianabacter salinae]
MRVLPLTLVVLIPLAANSILNRLAILDGEIGALDFAAIRLASGAAMLALLILWRDGALPRVSAGRITGAASLLIYMLFFSLAYLRLDAGIGALILFGGVQVTMFAGALLAREAIPARRWIGAALAFSGLVYLMWPRGGVDANLAASLSMAFAALGWGIYSLIGRRIGDPLRDTAENFLLAAPFAALAALLLSPGHAMSATGIALACVSGAITSALGYVLWYWLLARIASSVAAVVQLSVPILIGVAGIVFLSEPITATFAIAAALVLGGVAVAVFGGQRTKGSSGS